MENNLFKSYAEVDEILSLMEKKYIEKVPKKMREMFKDKRLKGYNPNINPNIPLDEQNLQRKTYAILAMLNINYWCKDENERQSIIRIYSENDKKREAEIREKYNPHNIFKTENKKKETETNYNTELTKYKEENFLKKIIREIKAFFKKR